ncbi:MAG TPA: ATP-binding protein [Trebonia sp.]|nr:ATP-binding protein [Trebonia sp.]
MAEVTRLRTAAGLTRANRPDSVPPLIAIGPDTTMALLLGGGPGLSRPGAASLAHHGVLFLHQAPEISREVLGALRQPLETGQVTIARGGPGGQVTTFPARYLLVVSASPCPCTAAGTPPQLCQCTPVMRRRYLGRLAGPLLDQVTVKAQMTIPSERDGQALSPCTAVVAARVKAARDRAAFRLAGTPWHTNAGIPADALRAFPVRLAALAFYLGDHDWLSQYAGNRHFPVPH